MFSVYPVQTSATVVRLYVRKLCFDKHLNINDTVGAGAGISW